MKVCFRVYCIFMLFAFAPVLRALNYHLNFDGADDYVSLGSGINLSNSDFTMECWFKSSTTFGRMITIGSNIPTNYSAAGISISSSNTLSFYFYGDNGTYSFTNGNAWYHVAFTYKHSTKEGKLYFNGVHVASRTFGNSLQGSGSNRLGSRIWGGTGDYWTGNLDEVRIWNVERSAAQIEESYGTEISGATSGLIAYYRLNETVGSTANDETSNNRDGTLNNFSLSGYTSNWIMSDNPFPVELTSFDVKRRGNEAVLSWVTATEVNNYGFEIERKRFTDTENDAWQRIGFVSGSGNSNATRAYTFHDNLPLAPSQVYRLKQIDNDGSFTYSPEAVLNNYFIATDFTLHQNFPNPFNPSTTIRFSLPQETQVTLIVYSPYGETVAVLLEGQSIEAGEHQINFNADNLSSGVYLYKMFSSDRVISRKMTILK